VKRHKRQNDNFPFKIGNRLFVLQLSKNCHPKNAVKKLLSKTECLKELKYFKVIFILRDFILKQSLFVAKYLQLHLCKISALYPDPMGRKSILTAPQFETQDPFYNPFRKTSILLQPPFCQMFGGWLGQVRLSWQQRLIRQNDNSRQSGSS